MKITRSRLEEIIQEEVNSIVKEDSYRTQYEVGVEDLEEDLAFFDDSAEEEQAEAEEEGAETAAASPYIASQQLQKEDIMKMVREELEAMMSEEGKPSAGLSKKKKSDVAKKARKGGDIGKKGKEFDKIASKAAKKYGSKEAGEKVAAAAMWKNIKR
jgi:hypothetical protein